MNNTEDKSFIFRNLIIFAGSIILFLSGCMVYGVFLNLNQKPLYEAMQEKNLLTITNPSIIIDRTKYTLTINSDTTIVKTYRAVFGRNSAKKKEAKDKATPRGEYKICEILPKHLYHVFIRLNYPNISDIDEALRNGNLSQQEYDDLRFQYFYKGCPNSATYLGGNLGIHGMGQLSFLLKNLPFVFNWTDGSIAISNEDIDELLPYLKKGMRVVIKD